MRRVRVAVIGIGHLGRFHVEKFARMPEAQLVGVADIVEERARQAGEKYGIFWTTDFRELLPRADALSVVTPTVTHYRIAREGLAAGKHLFVEKPLTEHPETAAELVELAEKTGVILQVGHIERFQPSVKALLQRVKHPLFVEAHRLSPFSPRALDVDVILDLMIHDLDLLLALNPGQRVKALLAAGAPVLSPRLDIASVRLVFENGLSANLTASRISLSPQRRFRVFEKGGYFSADTLNRRFFWVRMDEEGHLHPEELSFPQADPLYEELRSFVRAVLNGSPPPVSGKEGLKALELAHRIKLEIEEHLRQHRGALLEDR
ncbi:MAG TPA: Gfo/Idh/MocA family oxidoreductase [Thermosulfurimonas dismutans]|uniref:Gfo/Idh/MocA family oxidoreductase n=1 Tax=Thermosulfurimonas dismutans TaxID=999894 RepID=A0A7C3CRL5_9BACT|nr:Gfo/Idh/MocA family oxidoreductase [Thermosulfurimonas dismutans]